MSKKLIFGIMLAFISVFGIQSNALAGCNVVGTQDAPGNSYRDCEDLWNTIGSKAVDKLGTNCDTSECVGIGNTDRPSGSAGFIVFSCKTCPSGYTKTKVPTSMDDTCGTMPYTFYTCVPPCSTSKSCPSPYSGTYNECSQDQSSQCSKTCEKPCSGNATCPDHADCTWDESYKTSGTQYYGSNSCSASSSTCPVKSITCEDGFYKDGDICKELSWQTKTATGVWTNSAHTAVAMMRCGDCCKTDCWLPSGTYYDRIGKFTETCGSEPSKPLCIDGAEYSVVDGTCKITCSGGYFLPSGAVACQNCPINNYCPAGSTSPTPCENAPENAQYTDANVETSDCPWECKDGYKLSGSTCVADCSGYNIGSGSFACVDPSVDGVAHGYYAHDGGRSSTTYGLTTEGTWITIFSSYGQVKGEASCNTTNGVTQGAVKSSSTFSNTNSGNYCWCRMTSPSGSGWVFAQIYVGGCAQYCASSCASLVKTGTAFREAMYGSVN